ncbi:MAG: Neutral trehalase [Candidatus Saccharibacteria bacterium GW2011_GWC2_48_9]|nr:MAG: Neutral trehalase [Candidatus Saccharibacteria bacterium GW2011_GWC2_48_9]HCH34170.1 trehalase [Candidatus Saccharibacteria bacterium]
MPAKSVSHKLKTALVKTTGQLISPSKSPDEALGDFFLEVQSRQVYDDGKTFVDLIPKKRANQIVKEYRLAQKDPNFDLRDFVSRHFYEFMPDRQPEYIFSPTVSPREHARGLWSELRRRNRKDRGSLIALPHEYVVPGGRFSEQFYWDSYFIMLGLAADGHWDIMHGMMQNYQYMIRKFGFIPTANRTYFLSRSQPPFFSHMVKLMAGHRGRTRTYLEFLPSMVAEYRFWMKGRRSVNEHLDHQAFARVVQMPNGVILNRYYDNKTSPRPESLREDLETAERSSNANKEKLFLDLRAGAESGWDFSSRWFRNSRDIESIHTTDLVPVDLNCLLYQLETTIAETYQLLRQPLLKRKFQAFADKRAQTILRYCWDEEEQFFCDYDFREGKSTGRVTLAGVFPLYAKIATSQQAKAVAERLEQDFLKDGGLITTLVDNGQQWDAPNGWAPLHWTTIQGLRAYGYYTLADDIKQRWMHSTEQVFSTKHKMIEKYDVAHESRVGGGGEYPLQDGFGWTNGVYAALRDEDEK